MRWFGLYLERGEEEVAEKHRRMLWNILGASSAGLFLFLVGRVITCTAVVYAYMYFVRTQDNETHTTHSRRGLVRQAVMKRRGGGAGGGDTSGVVAADVADRALSADAKARAQKKAVARHVVASHASPQPLPIGLFAVAAAVLGLALYLTLKYS